MTRPDYCEHVWSKSMMSTVCSKCGIHIDDIPKVPTHAQHARREWSLRFDDVLEEGVIYTYGKYCPTPDVEFVHVREVLPGEITITREEFKAAYRKACGRITMNKSFETILEAELWPEGQDGG